MMTPIQRIAFVAGGMLPAIVATAHRAECRIEWAKDTKRRKMERFLRSALGKVAFGATAAFAAMVAGGRKDAP